MPISSSKPFKNINDAQKRKTKSEIVFQNDGCNSKIKNNGPRLKRKKLFNLDSYNYLHYNDSIFNRDVNSATNRTTYPDSAPTIIDATNIHAVEPAPNNNLVSLEDTNIDQTRNVSVFGNYATSIHVEEPKSTPNSIIFENIDVCQTGNEASWLNETVSKDLQNRTAVCSKKTESVTSILSLKEKSLHEECAHNLMTSNSENVTELIESRITNCNKPSNFPESIEKIKHSKHKKEDNVKFINIKHNNEKMSKKHKIHKMKGNNSEVIPEITQSVISEEQCINDPAVKTSKKRYKKHKLCNKINAFENKDDQNSNNNYVQYLYDTLNDQQMEKYHKRRRKASHSEVIPDNMQSLVGSEVINERHKSDDPTIETLKKKRKQHKNVCKAINGFEYEDDQISNSNKEIPCLNLQIKKKHKVNESNPEVTPDNSQSIIGEVINKEPCSVNSEVETFKKGHKKFCSNAINTLEYENDKILFNNKDLYNKILKDEQWKKKHKHKRKKKNPDVILDSAQSLIGKEVNNDDQHSDDSKVEIMGIRCKKHKKVRSNAINALEYENDQISNNDMDIQNLNKSFNDKPIEKHKKHKRKESNLKVIQDNTQDGKIIDEEPHSDDSVVETMKKRHNKYKKVCNEEINTFEYEEDQISHNIKDILIKTHNDRMKKNLKRKGSNSEIIPAKIQILMSSELINDNLNSYHPAVVTLKKKQKKIQTDAINVLEYVDDQILDNNKEIQYLNEQMKENHKRKKINSEVVSINIQSLTNVKIINDEHNSDYPVIETLKNRQKHKKVRYGEISNYNNEILDFSKTRDDRQLKKKHKTWRENNSEINTDKRLSKVGDKVINEALNLNYPSVKMLNKKQNKLKKIHNIGTDILEYDQISKSNDVLCLNESLSNRQCRKKRKKKKEKGDSMRTLDHAKNTSYDELNVIHEEACLNESNTDILREKYKKDSCNDILCLSEFSSDSQHKKKRWKKYEIDSRIMTDHAKIKYGDEVTATEEMPDLNKFISDKRKLHKKKKDKNSSTLINGLGDEDKNNLSNTICLKESLLGANLHIKEKGNEKKSKNIQNDKSQTENEISFINNEPYLDKVVSWRKKKGNKKSRSEDLNLCDKNGILNAINKHQTDNLCSLYNELDSNAISSKQASNFHHLSDSGEEMADTLSKKNHIKSKKKCIKEIANVIEPNNVAQLSNKMEPNNKKLDENVSPCLDFNEIPLDFEIPPLHIYGAIHDLTENQKEEVLSQGITIKRGKFSYEEDSIIKKNYENFMQLIGDGCDLDFHDIFGIGRGQRDDNILRFLKSKHFYVRLGKGLNDRTLWSIYRRARLLLHPDRVKGRFDETDVKDLKRLQKQVNNKWSHIGGILERTEDNCLQAYRWHDKNISRGKWTEKEKDQLITALETVVGSSDLSCNNVKGICWDEVADHVPTRNSSQCRMYWANHLAWEENSSERKKWDKSCSKKLLNILHKDWFVENPSEIDWLKVYNFFKDVAPSHIFLQKKWLYLKSRVPQFKEKNYKSILNTLYEMYNNSPNKTSAGAG